MPQKISCLHRTTGTDIRSFLNFIKQKNFVQNVGLKCFKINNISNIHLCLYYALTFQQVVQQ